MLSPTITNPFTGTMALTVEDDDVEHGRVGIKFKDVCKGCKIAGLLVTLTTSPTADPLEHTDIGTPGVGVSPATCSVSKF